MVLYFIINVQLKSGSILDEVVVIGYGTTKKEDATGSIQTVDQKAFNKGSITSPQELLAGKIAGVNITTNSGAPGDGAVIRIRGGSSLSASNDPLIVIDGVPIDNGGISGSRNSLNLINPNDIETFTVLKDGVHPGYKSQLEYTHHSLLRTFLKHSRLNVPDHMSIWTVRVLFQNTDTVGRYAYGLVFIKMLVKFIRYNCMFLINITEISN